MMKTGIKIENGMLSEIASNCVLYSGLRDTEKVTPKERNDRLNAKEKSEGLRFNEGKLRVDLVPSSAGKGIAEVLTFGAKKYAENNWRLGMKWSKVVASLERHLMAFKEGQDYDPESKLLHVDHILTNAAFIKEYYKIAPHFDDRNQGYLNMPRIGLDIDEILCDWLGGWIERRGIKERPHSWLFDRHIQSEFDKMEREGSLNDFMLSLKPLINPKELPFEPACYITARRIPNEISEQWLDIMGFPTAPVYTVKPNTSKVETAKQAEIDIFVDDNYKNFVELNKAGICTYLYDAPHNQRYDVGYKRIYSLKELI